MGALYIIYVMAFLKPEVTVNSFRLVPGMLVADFGCGSGHWGVALANKVAGKGTVYAFDIRAGALEATRSRAKLHGVDNIETSLANLELARASKLKEGMIDLVLCSTILSQTINSQDILAEAHRILKRGGHVAAVEWDSSDSLLTSPAPFPLHRSKLEKLFIQAGFIFEHEFNAGSYHYGLMFKKPW